MGASRSARDGAREREEALGWNGEPMSFSSERREPKDLPSAPPLPWGGRLRFMKALALGGLAIAALGALPFFHDIARILCATFGLTIALIGAIALAGVALSRRRARAEVEAIARGAFLA